MLTRLLVYARNLVTRRRIDAEASDELRFHIEQETAAHIGRGMSPAEARRIALRDLGGVTQAREAVREVRATWIDRVLLEVRDAVRGLRGGWSTSILALVILSLTMTAGTITFSVVDAVALRPLPYGAPERLVSISRPSQLPNQPLPASPQHYFMWLEGARAFESLGAARFTGPLQLDLDGAGLTVTTRSVTANLFDVLGVRPVLGQFFGPEDERPGSPARVILSHALWAGAFHADPNVIGRVLRFGAETRTVVGVLPMDVSFPIFAGPPPDLYTPYVATASDRSNDRAFSMSVVGRLRSGVAVAQARADISRISSAVVLPLQDQVIGPAKTWLLLVLAAVGLVLIIACINVAHLLLARAATRAPEFATREALGASRGRLARGLLFEGLILAGMSASVGLIASYGGLEFVKSQLPPELTRVSSVAINARVLFASMIASVLSVLIFASAPAWLVARSDLIGLMKGSGGAVVGGRRRDRSLAAFLVADIAFVCVLLVATTLVVTSFVFVTTADLGFDRQNVMSLGYRRSLQDVAPAGRPAAALALRTDLLDRVKALPGVMFAAISANATMPLSGRSVRYSIEIPGIGETIGDEMLETNMVTPDYFRALGMRLARGRTFAPSDRAGAPLVMIINDVAARRFFAGRDPIGQVVTFRGPTTIVGVLQDVHFRGPEAAAPTAMYIPVDQDPYYNDERQTQMYGNLVVRTTQDARRFATALRDAIRPVLHAEPSQPIFVDDFFRRITAARRFNASLMAVFGVIAVVIGAIGVYGTMAFVVARQVRPIGLRMALGATPSSIIRLIVRDALRRVALGTAIGLIAAWAVSAAFKAFVFGIAATEPLVYVGVGGFLAFVGFAAALFPALRASRIDPLIALRSE